MARAFAAARDRYRPWHGTLAALLAYVGGVVFRYYYIFVWHDPRKYVYSDMQMYVELAKRIARPGYKLGIHDVTHPPGFTELLSWSFARDNTFGEMVWIQLVVASLVPLAVALVGWLTFGRASAKAALAVASIYYPFAAFGGYFLAEVHITLWGTLTVAAYFGAIKLAAWMRPGWRRLLVLVVVGLVGGVLYSISATMKMVAMPALAATLAIHFLFTKSPVKRWLRAVIISAMIVGSLPLMKAQADRCTRANDGQFCSGSNKSAADFLLGHYGRIQGIIWRDPTVPGVVGFGNPSAYQHGYTDKPEMPFLITNQKRNNEAAWGWIKQHPTQAAILTVEHVWDAFGGAHTWPPNATSFWVSSQVAVYVFLIFFLFPTLYLFYDILRTRGVLGFFTSLELAVVAPIFGVMLAVGIATGETRYRIPWDAAFIVLAIEFYRRIRFRWSAPDGGTGDAAPVPEDA
jgi:hypothetical protein